jgi:hypothetical protein
MVRVVSTTDEMLARISAKVAKATGDDEYQVHRMLVDDPEAFEEKYAQYLSDEEKQFLGMGG